MCESECGFSPDRWQLIFTFKSNPAYVHDVVKIESKSPWRPPDSKEVVWVQDRDIKIVKPLEEKFSKIAYNNQKENIMTVACKVHQSISRCFINPPLNSMDTTMRAAHIAIETQSTC